MKRHALIALFASLHALSATAVAEPRLLTIEDHGRISYVANPVVSPDGRQVVYELDNQLYVIGMDGGEARAITSNTSSASDPYWSRDGNALYFISDRTGTNQVWKLPLDSFGEAEPVTDLRQGVSALNFSTDESRLLLSYDDMAKSAGNEESGAADGKEPWVISRLQFKHDAADGYLAEPASDHVYVYDLESSEIRQVTGGGYAESEAAWSPDGTRIVFVSNRDAEPDAGYRNDLWLVPSEPAGAPEDMTPRRLTGGDDVKSSPAFSPDGQRIAYLTAEDGVYGISRLAVIPATGGEPSILTDGLDRWVSDFRFSDDGKWIWFTYDNHGGVHLGRIRLRDGRLERVLEGDVVVSAFDAGDSVVVLLNNRNDAPDLYRVRGGRPERLTEVNREWFAGMNLGEKEKVSFESSDGTVIEAFITRPPDYREGQRYPTILDIHGGPVGQFSWGYDFGTQFLAANGYVVVEPNPRGSTGRGQAFVRAIYQTWGITDYPDVVAAVDHAVELGYADPEALAVTGYSYGGYMTNVVITRTARFKAAASGAGHSFIAANYGHDIYQRWYNWELGVPWSNRAKYDRLSPLLEAGRVETPTIFLGGREDWNVPILNAELFYQALRKQGIDSQLVVYPDSHHGGWDARFEKDYLERVVGWFDRYTKPR